MKLYTAKFKLTFTEPLLGSQPLNRELLEAYIASKAPTTEATLEEVDNTPQEEKVENKSTGFASDGNSLLMWDYQLRGMFKETMKVMIELGETVNPSLNVWNIHGAVDNFLFVNPRRIYLRNADGSNITKAHDFLQRSIRVKTAQGDRVAIARSEKVDPGSWLEFEVRLMVSDKKNKKAEKVSKIEPEDLKNCLLYGSQRGFGQWRSGGYGRYNWTTLSEKLIEDTAIKAIAAA